LGKKGKKLKSLPSDGAGALDNEYIKNNKKSLCRVMEPEHSAKNI
jgi:hypothetical protein